MFKKSLLKFLASVGMFCLPPLMAHHQFSSEFDASNPVNLSGKVRDLSWSEPHVTFILDARGGSWKVEAASPSKLLVHELTSKTLKDGDSVRVQGYVAKDGSMSLSGRVLDMNGKSYIIADPAEDGGPPISALPEPVLSNLPGSEQ